MLLHIAPDLRAKAIDALHDVHVRHDQHLRFIRTGDLLKRIREDIRVPERVLRELNGVTEAILLHVS